MRFSTIVGLSVPIAGALAMPQGYCMLIQILPDDEAPSQSSLSLTTLSLTLATTSTHTYTAGTTTSAPPTSTSAAPITTPSTALTLVALRSASPIHFLGANAAGLHLNLGGGIASYCPHEIVGNCPPGNVTAFAGTCSMDVEVPGGQQIYIAPDGSLGYTQAHSASRPEGANLCPLTYSKAAGATFGYWGLNPAVSFGATGFMACPTGDHHYQIFAALQNATVPGGDVSECLGFDAAAPEYTGEVAAWQYT